MTFSTDEIERYARHLVLGDVGGRGQQALKAARVGVIGAGGLGSPVIAYLAAAGVGTLRIIDDDVVALSNLQRQIIHGTSDVGRLKTRSAQDAAAKINPNVSFEMHDTRLSSENVMEFVTGCDVVADGSDNAHTRYLVADACASAHVPLVNAAVHGFDGHVTTLVPFRRGPDGRANPTYRCLFPDPPPDAMVDVCAREGILGVVTGVVGTIQANEVIKLIVGYGTPLIGRLLLYDARESRFEEIEYERLGEDSAV